MKNKPVQALPAPDLTRADEARLQLRVCSEMLHAQALEAGDEAMYLERQSARVEAIAEGVDDDGAILVRDLFVQEGLLEILPGTNTVGGQA